MSFSERHALAHRALQRGKMNARLRNALWNAFAAFRDDLRVGNDDSALAAPVKEFTTRDKLHLSIWAEFLSQPRDLWGSEAVPIMAGEFRLRDWFFAAKWHGVYDFIEFVAGGASDRFAGLCNEALERERSAYRLVQGNVVELTDNGQVKAIDNAVAATIHVPPVREHLKTALKRLADRPNPDYRNSIKESISAVESLAKMMTSSLSPSTLADALKGFDRVGIPLHPALNKAWQNMYGYTSDQPGVRHGLRGESHLDDAEAAYMLVSCSAIVSYMLRLADRSGISMRE